MPCVDGRSARSSLLFRGRRRRHGDVPEGQFELRFDHASAGGGPVLGRELEVPVAGPVRHDAEDVGEVVLGVEPVQKARGDEREQVGSSLGVVVGAEKQPGLSPDRKSRFILPVSRFAQGSITRGIPRFGSRWTFCTESRGEAKTFTSAFGPTGRES